MAIIDLKECFVFKSHFDYLFKLLLILNSYILSNILRIPIANILWFRCFLEGRFNPPWSRCTVRGSIHTEGSNPTYRCARSNIQDHSRSSQGAIQGGQSLEIFSWSLLLRFTYIIESTSYSERKSAIHQATQKGKNISGKT